MYWKLLVIKEVFISSIIPIFHDLSYDIHMPTKKLGNFTLFGFGGLSSQEFKQKLNSGKWKGYRDRFGSKFCGNTGMSAITHTISLGALYTKIGC
jgi:hypothetical protein